MGALNRKMLREKGLDVNVREGALAVEGRQRVALNQVLNGGEGRLGRVKVSSIRGDE